MQHLEIWSDYRFFIYGGTGIGSSECSTDGNADGKLENLLLGSWLGFFDWIDLGNNEGIELCF